MSTELRVKLSGPPGGMDANRVTQDLQQLVKLLNELEDARVGHNRTVRGHSKWSFAHLKLGSVEAGLAPLEPRAGATWSDLDAVSADVLNGFSHAESHDSLPDRWAPEAARPARVIASHLGSTADTGMTLTLIVNGEAVRTIGVTRRASINLQRALQVRTKSIGSAIGTLRSVSLHGRNRAGLWLDRTGQRVNVKFENEHIPGVRELLGRRVMIKGELDRNSSGQLLAIKFKRADVLPTRDESPRLSSYTGICPDITDGRSIPEHLEIIRGAS